MRHSERTWTKDMHHCMGAVNALQEDTLRAEQAQSLSMSYPTANTFPAQVLSEMSGLT